MTFIETDNKMNRLVVAICLALLLPASSSAGSSLFRDYLFSRFFHLFGHPVAEKSAVENGYVFSKLPEKSVREIEQKFRQRYKDYEVIELLVDHKNGVFLTTATWNDGHYKSFEELKETKAKFQNKYPKGQKLAFALNGLPLEKAGYENGVSYILQDVEDALCYRKEYSGKGKALQHIDCLMYDRTYAFEFYSRNGMNGELKRLADDYFQRSISNLDKLNLNIRGQKQNKYNIEKARYVYTPNCSGNEKDGEARVVFSNGQKLKIILSDDELSQRGYLYDKDGKNKKEVLYDNRIYVAAAFPSADNARAAVVHTSCSGSHCYFPTYYVFFQEANGLDSEVTIVSPGGGGTEPFGLDAIDIVIDGGNVKDIILRGVVDYETEHGPGGEKLKTNLKLKDGRFFRNGDSGYDSLTPVLKRIDGYLTTDIAVADFNNFFENGLDKQESEIFSKNYEINEHLSNYGMRIWYQVRDRRSDNFLKLGINKDKKVFQIISTNKISEWLSDPEWLQNLSKSPALSDVRFAIDEQSLRITRSGQRFMELNGEQSRHGNFLFLNDREFCRVCSGLYVSRAKDEYKHNRINSGRKFLLRAADLYANTFPVLERAWFGRDVVNGYFRESMKTKKDEFLKKLFPECKIINSDANNKTELSQFEREGFYRYWVKRLEKDRK